MWCANREQWGFRRQCQLLVLLLSGLAPAHAVGAQTLGQLAKTNGCSTKGIGGVSRQLVSFHQCTYPDAVVSYLPHDRISATNQNVHGLATVETRASLNRAAQSVSLRINSGFRPISDQYVLYKSGACGAAAKPGSSNHQSGKAVDVANWQEARSALLAAGCKHPLPSTDPVHFDCPGPDIRKQSVLIFQKLWNINHPNDKITEDGLYGPQTEGKLASTPADGFSKSGCMEMMDESAWSAVLVDSTLETGSTTQMAPGAMKMVTIEIRNMGKEAWDERVRLRVSEPRDRKSLFVGSDWEDESTPRKVQGSVAPGDTFKFTFTLEAPQEAGTYDETFALAVDGGPWFSEQGGPADNALLFRIEVSEQANTSERPTPADAEGCRVRRSRSRFEWPWLALALGASLLGRRRDSRR